MFGGGPQTQAQTKFGSGLPSARPHSRSKHATWQTMCKVMRLHPWVRCNAVSSLLCLSQFKNKQAKQKFLVACKFHSRALAPRIPWSRTSLGGAGSQLRSWFPFLKAKAPKKKCNAFFHTHNLLTFRCHLLHLGSAWPTCLHMGQPHQSNAPRDGLKKLSLALTSPMANNSATIGMCLFSSTSY